MPYGPQNREASAGPTSSAANGHGRFKFDLTVNVPTLLALLSFAVSMSVSGVKAYQEFNQKLVDNAKDIASVTARVSTLEQLLPTSRNESEARTQALRAEVKSELSEIKSDLKTLLFNNRGVPSHNSPSNKQLREWSR